MGLRWERRASQKSPLDTAGQNKSTEDFWVRWQTRGCLDLKNKTNQTKKATDFIPEREGI